MLAKEGIHFTRPQALRPIEAMGWIATNLQVGCCTTMQLAPTDLGDIRVLYQ